MLTARRGPRRSTYGVADERASVGFDVTSVKVIGASVGCRRNPEGTMAP